MLENTLSESLVRYRLAENNNSVPCSNWSSLITDCLRLAAHLIAKLVLTSVALEIVEALD